MKISFTHLLMNVSNILKIWLKWTKMIFLVSSLNAVFTFKMIILLNLFFFHLQKYMRFHILNCIFNDNSWY
jgi:hypothetical protein